MILTNVDFNKTESSFRTMEFGTLSDETDLYEVPGIITSNAKNFSGCATGFYSDFYDLYEPKPCGRFTWNGGKVTNHNYDINPTTQSSEEDPIFSPFLNLALLEEVIITGINVSLNSIITSA